MKATLIEIHNDADFTEAKALVEALMGSDDPKDRARMVAQARLVEACESAPESNAFRNPLRRP
jgi:antitoxin component HigA of HigAB toxin-antitoxin module